MAGQTSAQERTEEATPRRKQQARKKGSAARSQDLTSALIVGGLLIGLPPAADKMSSAWVAGFKQAVPNMPRDVEFSSITAYVGKVASGPMLAMMPLLGMILGLGLAVNFAQVGFVFSPEALKPSWERMNPLSGLKRMFSLQAGVEGLKASIKSVLFMYLAGSAIQTRWAEVVNLSWTTPGASAEAIGGILHQVATRIAIAWLVLAALDTFYQRKQLAKNLRMTKEELKQEFKETEQSPELKGAMARQRRKLTKMRALDAARTADVIITNPTHFSVALKYDPGQMHAPQVVAKGVDHLALKIRQVANEHRIPIVPNPPLARQLYKQCEVGDNVPRDLFQAVAEVLAFVYGTLRRAS